MSPRAGWQTTHSRMSPLDLANPPEAVEPAIPVFRYLRSRPGRASSQALAGLTEVRRQGRSCCSQLDCCRVFYQVSRRPGHAATASLTPSKPVAPVSPNLNDPPPESMTNRP